MAKKRLFQIAKECGVPFEEALELAFKHLEDLDQREGARDIR